MGTRGLMGIRIDGVDKAQYVHCDAYPSGLGEDIVQDIRELLADQDGLDGMRRLARALRVVPHDGRPSPTEAAEFAEFADHRVGNRGQLEWYALLRDLQGELESTLRTGVIVDGSEFILNSTFCEYAYYVNLDDLRFEVYRGFQRTPHVLGRYANRTEAVAETGCYPCALVADFPLQDISEDWERLAFPEDDDG